MRSPSLRELPAPPAGATGWPWTEETPVCRTRMPRISIVTPSFNQARFLEETIRSVLLQGYDDLEFIVVDGASSDGSVDVIRRYAPWLTRWVSEPDRGQCHAINKGLAASTGEYFNYVNSDDTLAPGALIAVADAFARHPSAVLVHGRCVIGDASGRPRSTFQAAGGDFRQTFRDFLVGSGLHPLSTFARRQALLRVDGYREDLEIEMDLDLWMRLLDVPCPMASIDETLGTFRCYDDQKSASHRRLDEMLGVLRAALDRHAELADDERDELAGQAAWHYARRKLWAASSSFQAGRVRDYLECCVDALRESPAVAGSWIFWTNALAPVKAVLPPPLVRRRQAG